MDENLTDQQRAEQVRGWLAENGWYLLAGVALGLAALFGYRQYTGYSESHAEQASALYEELLGAIRVNRTVRAEELTAELAADYGGSPYLDQARLAMARMKLERSLPDEAVKYLREVVNGSRHREIADIARLRLGRVLAWQEKYDEALKELEPPSGSALAASYHDARGDVYTAMNRPADAAREYQEALKAESAGTIDPNYVRAKLDEVGGAAPEPATAPAAPAAAPAP